MTAEELRKVSGGVLGHFTPLEITVDVAEDAALAETGDNAVGIKVPANKFVYGAYIKNVANDLASEGSATVGVKVGSTTVVSGTAIASVKGAGVAALDATPDFDDDEREVKLSVGTADLTAGKLTIGVIYG